MAFDANSFTTGLLGYKLKKDILGNGLYYRETEVYNWKVYARSDIFNSNLTETPYSEIETIIRNAFATYSGDITIKALDTPGGYQFPNDHIRLGEFNVEVEIKKPLTAQNLEDHNKELITNRYKGIDKAFVSTYGTHFNDFSEDFIFSTKEDGKNVYSHNVSFSLLSGGQALAQAIISDIFADDKDTDFGINVLAGNAGSALANTDDYLNFYNESYNLATNSYNFEKRREVLPIGVSTYLYDLNNSITYKTDGTIDVSEKGKIEGKLSFANAQDGYSALYNGAYTRCNVFYNDYKDTVSAESISDSLITFPINSSRSLNKFEKKIEYDVSFTNDPRIISSTRYVLDKTTDIEQTEENFININQSYSYSVLSSPISGNSDPLYVETLYAASGLSTVEVPNLYSAGSFYNAAKPNMNLIKISATAPNRQRQFNIALSYTNNPIYFVTLEGTTYAILEYKVTDVKPFDIITEYKIINRPTKSSLVNYAYQTEKGSKSASVTAKMTRPNDNVFSSPVDVSTRLVSLYKYSIGKILGDFATSAAVLACSYHLSDVKYSVNSDNEITMDIVISYIIKKYVA